MRRWQNYCCVLEQTCRQKLAVITRHWRCAFSAMHGRVLDCCLIGVSLMAFLMNRPLGCKLLSVHASAVATLHCLLLVYTGCVDRLCLRATVVMRFGWSRNWCGVRV